MFPWTINIWWNQSLQLPKKIIQRKTKDPNKIFLNVSLDRQHLVEPIFATTQKNHSKKNKRPQ
jgi:hypothetical protein